MNEFYRIAVIFLNLSVIAQNFSKLCFYKTLTELLISTSKPMSKDHEGCSPAKHGASNSINCFISKSSRQAQSRLLMLITQAKIRWAKSRIGVWCPWTKGFVAWGLGDEPTTCPGFMALKFVPLFLFLFDETILSGALLRGRSERSSKRSDCEGW